MKILLKRETKVERSVATKFEIEVQKAGNKNISIIKKTFALSSQHASKIQTGSVKTFR